jgi:hypothetical protein
LWNANIWTQHTEKLKTSLFGDALHWKKLSNYAIYHMNSPLGTAIIKNFLQATSVSIEGSVHLLTILAVYLAPRYTIKQEQFEGF